MVPVILLDIGQAQPTPGQPDGKDHSVLSPRARVAAAVSVLNAAFVTGAR
jgi:hypothetical protein